MRDESNESLLCASSEADEDDPGGDRTALTVLRRPLKGMGSSCEDCNLEGEPVLLGDGDCEGFEARLDEVNGSCRDQRLEADSGDHESKEVTLGTEEERGDCSINTSGLADYCEEFVVGVREAQIEVYGVLGVEKETGHLELEKEVDVCVSKTNFEVCEAEAHPEINSSVVDKTMEVGDRDSKNDHGKLVSKVEGQGVFGPVEENGHLTLEQPVEVGVLQKDVDLSELHPSSANGDIANPNVHSAASSGAEEDSQLLELAENLELKAPEPIKEENYDHFQGLKALEGDRYSTYENASDLRDNAVGAKHHALKAEATDKEHVGSGFGESVSGRKKAKEEIGHLDLKQALALGAPESVTKEENDEFPGLSPLRTVRGGDFCSMFGIGSEMGFLSPEVFDNGVRSGCEDSELLVSSGLAADFPLAKINRDVGSQNVADYGGRSNPKSSSIIVLRRSNPKRSASLRENLADDKYNPLRRSTNDRRNVLKAVDISPTFLLSTVKISEKLKRKRSCSHRQSRSSVWAPVENLLRIFDHNVIPANYDTEINIPYTRSRKGRFKTKTQKDDRSRRSSVKHSAKSDNVEAKQKLAGNKLLQRYRQLGDKDMDSSLTQDASVELSECPGVSSRIVPEMLVEIVSDGNSLDPGTSPDSDVYHPVMDAGLTTSEGANSSDQVCRTKDAIVASVGTPQTNQVIGVRQNVLALAAVSEDCMHSAVSTSSETLASCPSIPPLDPNLCTKAKKGKRNSQFSKHPCLSEHFSVVEKLQGPENLNDTKMLSNGSKSNQKKQYDINKKNRACSQSNKKTTLKGSKGNSFPHESSYPETAELECLQESIKEQCSLDKWACTAQDVSNPRPEVLLHTDKINGHKLLSGTNLGVSKSRLHHDETTGRRRQHAHGQTGKLVQKPGNSCDSEEISQTVDTHVEAVEHMRFSSESAKPTLTMSSQQSCNRAIPEDTSLSLAPVADQFAPNHSKTSLEQFIPPQMAWVLCDDCEKWRCISVELANTLEETKCKWTCKDNTDKAFADCSIPQEKTNAEINAELGISDEEDPSSVQASATHVQPSKLAASQRASWTLIKSNVFLHRNRKNQTIDETMVCHCKPPRDGRRGCGDQCLNRMLNIECAKGTCPCGDLCSNQRFLKRRYAKFQRLRCGKKGQGLQLQEDVIQGQFLIEYVGEVLDLATYEARQRYYASRGQKHFYFMTLNGGEVIDACVKGNLGRYINHSCEPNCRTEKWMVNGEVCIGLFAIRDIKKGEEVTFDYNYVRVVGAAAKKCICGSSECRGYLGGDPLNSEIIVQEDSDDEDFEPVMIHEKDQRELVLNDSVSNMNDVNAAKHKEISIEVKDIVEPCPPTVPEREVCVQNENDVRKAVPEVNPLDICQQSVHPMQSESAISMPIPCPQSLGESKHVQVEENICELMHDIQPQEASVQAPTTINEILSDNAQNSKKSVTNLIDEKPHSAKPRSLTKSSRSKGTIKRDRSSVKNLVSQKTKTLTPRPGGSHFEGVEEKLNELLDIDGGISKQKDATRGYLKLLFVTAAEGDVGARASQSTRDLSLILDAILKTKSRKVLVDIINKNGLQMLHNILKQNRGNFNRIPIIRKLLKALEFLALTGILTREQINTDPPCSGMESFKESILKLANHSDKQVHKIAREFRDKWIPRTFRRIEPPDRDGAQTDRQIPYRKWNQSLNPKFELVQASRETDAIVISPADHPPSSSAEPMETPSTPVPENIAPSGIKTRKRKTRWESQSEPVLPIEDQIIATGLKFTKCTSQCVEVVQDLMQVDDERPPGFENSSSISLVTGEVVVGHPQEIYISHVPVSYGVPVALMEQLGTPKTGGSEDMQIWAIAPGMPFHPFPPLPSYPRGQQNPRVERRRIHRGTDRDHAQPGAGSRNLRFNKRYLGPQRWDNRRFQRYEPRGPYQRFGRGFRGNAGVNNNDVGSNFHQPHN